MTKSKPVKFIIKKAKVPIPRIHCKGCNLLFTPADHRQQYHSVKCKERYYDKTYFKKQTVDKICKNCGVSFKTSAPLKQYYCKPECRKEYQQNHPCPSQIVNNEFKCCICGAVEVSDVRLYIEKGRVYCDHHIVAVKEIMVRS